MWGREDILNAGSLVGIIILMSTVPALSQEKPDYTPVSDVVFCRTYEPAQRLFEATKESHAAVVEAIIKVKTAWPNDCGPVNRGEYHLRVTDFALAERGHADIEKCPGEEQFLHAVVIRTSRGHVVEGFTLGCFPLQAENEEVDL